MRCLLDVTLTVIHDASDYSKNHYALSFAVNKLQDVGRDATIYDKELKMYFEDRSAQATVYEVELEYVYLNLDRCLAK